MSERRAGFFDYTRAELFKVLHRPYTYLFLAVMLAGEALLAALWASNVTSSNTITFTDGAGILVMGLSMGLYCAIVTGDMVFSDQFKNNTLKNEVSFGLPRGRIYLGKLLAACITAVCLCAVMIVFYLGLCRVLLPGDPESNLATLKLVGYCLLVALPLWLGAQALVNLVFFLIKAGLRRHADRSLRTDDRGLRLGFLRESAGHWSGVVYRFHCSRACGLSEAGNQLISEGGSTLHAQLYTRRAVEGLPPQISLCADRDSAAGRMALCDDRVDPGRRRAGSAHGGHPGGPSPVRATDGPGHGRHGL